MTREIVVVAHNIRSTHNVGSIFRTCEGFGVSRIIFSGYTPYPKITDDHRLPHIINKLTRAIHKTALGAELLVDFEYQLTPNINDLRAGGFTIIGLEQAASSVSIRTFSAPGKIALLIGEEVNGLEPDLMGSCDHLIEIPMQGQKESFNVSVATGIALFSLTR